MSFRFDCKKEGACYIKVHTPDWAWTNDAFPGSISIGDI